MTGTQLVTSAQVQELIGMPEAIDLVRDSIHRLSRGEFEMPARTQLGEGRLLSMACHHLVSGTSIVKSLSLNFEREPSIVGTVLWLDPESDHTIAIEAEAVTTLRTGAIVGVATDVLAPAQASRCTIIGTGHQARNQVRAVHAVRPLSQLSVVGRDRDRADHFRRAIADELGIADSTTCGSAAEALRDAEILCCSTNSPTPLFELADVPDAIHINAIGAFRRGMREVPDEVLAASTVVVDDLTASLEEAGDVIHAVEGGFLSSADLLGLGPVLERGAPPSTKTVFKSVGLAVQDWAIAARLAQRV